MIVKVWRRRRIAAFASVLAAGLLTVTGCAVTATTHATTVHAGNGTTLTAAGPGEGQGNTPGGVSTTALAGVPWRQVGPGWELVMYTTRTQTRHGPTTLYLVSPSGARYALYTWRAAATWAPSLIDWSGDKTRALLANGSGQMEQITLRTGAVSQFRLAGNAQAIGYTRPSGLNILGATVNGTSATFARYSLTGHLIKVLARGSEESTAIYSADGTRLAVSGAKGLELVSDRGGVIRSLPVPGTAPLMGCHPDRWYTPTIVLAGCTAPGTSIPRLWLVPVNGTQPIALAPQSNGSNGDLGDIGAWRMPSGLYMQSIGACGTLDIFKQAVDGSITRVTVPHTTGNDNLIATALGSRLLIQARTGCEGSDSLLWYNPGTHAEQWLLRAPATAFGVVAVIPYYTQEMAGRL